MEAQARAGVEVARDADVNEAADRHPKLPERRRRAMTEDSPSSAGENGRRPAPLLGQDAVTDRIHASMHEM